MKKIYLLAGMAALMLASCSTDEQASGGYVAGSTVTLNATLPNSGTRVTESASDTYGLITTWSADDSLDVLVNTNTIVSMTKGTTANTFTATPANATIGAGFNAGQTIYGVNNKYNDKITTAVNSSKLKATVDFTGQKGTVDNLKRYDLMYGKGDPTGNITFNHKICVLRLDISSDSLKADGITSITGLKLKYVATSGTKLFGSQEVYNFGATCDSTITDADSLYLNSTSIAVADGKATVYIAVPHRQNLFGTLYIKLKGSNGSTIRKVYDLTNGISLSNGRMLMSTVHPQAITALSRTKVNIGNYLFSDGTWGILADSLGSAKPIAVTFSKTTTTTDKGLGWTHGYAMALKNVSTSGNVWQNTAIDNATNPTGVFFANTTAAVSADKDGYTHTQMIHNNYSLGGFPAIDDVCYYYKVLVAAAPSNTSGWYLPAIGQWYDICVNLGGLSPSSFAMNQYGMLQWPNGCAATVVNNLNGWMSPTGNYTAFTAIGGYTNYCFWSSSESSSTGAYVAYFTASGMYLCGNTKTYTNYVRPVIAF